MIQFLRDYALIWRYAVKNRKPAPALRNFLSVILIIFGAFQITVTKALPYNTRIGLFTLFVLACTASYYWIRIFSGAVLLNVPMCAVLVPRIRIRAIQASLLAWFIAATMATLCFTATLYARIDPSCEPDLYGFLIKNTAQIFILTSAVLLGAGLLSTSLPVAIMISIGSWVVSLLANQLATILTAIFANNFALFSMILLLPLMAYYFVRTSFLKGGDKHCEKRDSFAKYLNSSAFTVQSPTRPLATGRTMPTDESFAQSPRFGMQAMYTKILRQDCAPGAPWYNLIIHVLGPQGHWSSLPSAAQSLIPRTAMGAGILAIVALIAYLGWHFVLMPGLSNPMNLFHLLLVIPQNRWIVILGLWLLFFIQLGRHAALLDKTQAEQKLFCLTANYQRNRFNRALGLQLLRSKFVDWLFWACLILLLSACIGTPIETLIGQFCIGSLCLPFICLALEDHSSKPKSFGLVFNIALSMAFPLITLLIFSGEPLWYLWLIISNVVLTLIIIAQRLSTLDRAPFAFPAGRLDD